MSSKRDLFVKRLGLLGLATVVNTLMGVILISVFTKGRPLEDYGLWVQVNVSLSLIPGLTCLGLPYTMVRYVAGEKDKSKIKETVYSIFSVILIVNAILSPLFSYIVIKYFGGGNLKIVPIFAIILFIQALNMVGWNYLRAMQRIKKYSLLMIVQNLMIIVGVGYAIVNGYGIYGALLALFFVSLLMFIILLYEIVSDLGLYKPKFTYLREFLKFGLPTIPGNFSAWIVSSSDRYLIGYFLGIKYVAYYNPAYSLGSLLNFIIGPLGFLLPAVLSKLYEERKIDEVKLYLEYLLKYYLIVAIPAVFGLSILAKPVLKILSTEEIAEKSYLIVPIIALSILFYGLRVIFGQIFILSKRTDISGKIWIIASLLNIGLNLIFIPYLGIMGAAITTLIAYTFAAIISMVYSKRLFNIIIDLKSIILTIISSSIMTIIMYALSFFILDENIWLLTSIFTGLISYVTLSFLGGLFNDREIRYFLSLVKKRRIL
ncbi:flippase [Methanothermococcus sp. SCGC AD-155-N22]|nr:flippase [Methanothermococcus sp. SCGC AD-155-N22]